LVAAVESVEITVPRIDFDELRTLAIQHWRATVSTESVFPKKSPFRRRHKRCYELAFKMLLHLAGDGKADTVTLVHGLVSGGISHAWLESNEEAYDAVVHVTMPVAEYVAAKGALVERRYTFKEACQLLRAKGHYGPWHEDEPLRESILAAFNRNRTPPQPVNPTDSV